MSIRSQFGYSLSDQGVVSLGNFLTIALGAHYLSLADQGKLVYLYSLYIAIVLFNTAAFFASANVVRRECPLEPGYRHQLAWYQGLTAVASGFLAALIFLAVEDLSGVDVTWGEILLAAGFLFIQQFVDFHRRAGYVFGEIPSSAAGSFWTYGLRILAILALHPESLTEYLVIMVGPSMPMFLIFLRRFWVDRSDRPYGRHLLELHLSLSKWNIYNAPLRWAGLHVPVLITGLLHSLEAAAIIGSLRALTTFANILLELLETFVPAWLAAEAVHGPLWLKKRSLRLLSLGGTFWVLGLLLVAVAGELAVEVLLGPHYRKYSHLLYVIWLSNGLYFLGRVIGMHYRVLKNARLEFRGSVLGVLALLPVVPLVQNLGAEGAAWGLVLTQAATLLMIMIQSIQTRKSK